jgi:predicted chitinase
MDATDQLHQALDALHERVRNRPAEFLRRSDAALSQLGVKQLGLAAIPRDQKAVQSPELQRHQEAFNARLQRLVAAFERRVAEHTDKYDRELRHLRQGVDRAKPLSEL